MNRMEISSIINFNLLFFKNTFLLKGWPQVQLRGIYVDAQLNKVSFVIPSTSISVLGIPSKTKSRRTGKIYSCDSLHYPYEGRWENYLIQMKKGEEWKIMKLY